MHIFYRLFLLIVLTGPGACAQFPALDGANTSHARDVGFVPFVPKAEILTIGSQTTPARKAANHGRLEQLASRAQALRGPVLTSAERARLRQAIP